MKSVKHVVLLTPGFARDEADTTCTTFLQDYLLALKRLHPAMSVELIALQYPFDRTHYPWNGIPIYSAHGKSSRYLSRLRTWIRAFRELQKLNRQQQIDVIHSFWLTEASFLAHVFSAVYGTRVVAYAIGQDALPANRYLAYPWFSKIKIVCMSRLISENLLKKGLQTSAIIPLGVDAAKVKPTQNERTIDILGVGSLIPLKCYSTFIDVVAALRMAFPGIRAELAGDGPEREPLQKKIHRLGLEETITLSGSISHEAVFAKLGASRFLLHPSSSEGQSTVMMEALAAGTHVICFDVGRMDDPSKIHVCTNVDEMIKTTTALLNNPTLDHTPVMLQTMDMMVNAFTQVYGR